MFNILNSFFKFKYIFIENRNSIIKYNSIKKIIKKGRVF